MCARLVLLPVVMLSQREQSGLLDDVAYAGLCTVLVMVVFFGLKIDFLGRGGQPASCS